MVDTTARTQQIDEALQRLVAATDRPWDGQRSDENPARHRRDDQGLIGRLLARWSISDSSGPPWWRRHLIREFGPGQSRRFPVLGIAGAVVIALAITAAVAMAGPTSTEAAPDLPAAAVSPSSAAVATHVVVDVVGKVVTPGLLTLPDGARVADALRASGGVLPGADVSSLNLARRLIDGEQLHVGVPIPPGAAHSSGAPGPVNLNLASPTQLDALPGVGQVTAQRIVDWRSKNGAFTKVEQLREVEGIGPAKFDDLRDLVTVR